jgi:hypothetical protein
VVPLLPLLLCKMSLLLLHLRLRLQQQLMVLRRVTH